MSESVIIRQGLLYLKNDEEESLIETLSEIESLYRQKPVLFENQGLNISRITVSVGLRVELKGEVLSLHLQFIRRSSRIEMESQTLQYDYTVWNKTVLPLNSEDVKLIMDALDQSKINDPDILMIAQYAKLIGYGNTHPELELVDDARAELSNHPSVLRETSDRLTAQLYDYQKVGVGWMSFIADLHGGCVLGDEMGLGKTLQIIALISGRIGTQDHPSLVVAPASLLENWRREFDKFTTGIDVFIHQGPRRTGNYMSLRDHDVVICSYNTLVTDLSMYSMIRWDILVLDEAQNIKNPKSIRARAVKKLNRMVSIAVTGTPFENHMTDLWSIMDFILPGYLGTSIEFDHLIGDDSAGAEYLEPMISPVILRRNVNQVAQDLPPRIDVPMAITMYESEAAEYEALRNSLIQSSGDQKVSLRLLTKLRMYCTHPSLVEVGSAVNSSKFDVLMDILEEICEMNEKVIIFAPYNGIFPIIEGEVKQRLRVPVFIINGSVDVSVRQETIDRFSDVHGSAVMILNPKAAGVGLNITAASRVIHYSLEWNPAVEDQASARAYRRGQKKTVFIYRLFYQGTVEELMNERLERKRDLFDKVIKGTDGIFDDEDDVVRAMSLSPLNGD